MVVVAAPWFRACHCGLNTPSPYSSRLLASQWQQSSWLPTGRAGGEEAAASRREPASVAMLDGAYARAGPGQQNRSRFEAICSNVEHEGCSLGRFALVRSVTERLPALLRAALLEQGWREGDAVTAISDRDPALPALVRSSTVLDGCYGLWPAGHPTRGVAPQILDAPLRAVAAGL